MKTSMAPGVVAGSCKPGVLDPLTRIGALCRRNARHWWAAMRNDAQGATAGSRAGTRRMGRSWAGTVCPVCPSRADFAAFAADLDLLADALSTPGQQGDKR